MEIQVCTTCNTMKPLTKDYYHFNNQRQCFVKQCKVCKNNKTKEYSNTPKGIDVKRSSYERSKTNKEFLEKRKKNT